METETHANEQFMNNLIDNACEADLNNENFVNYKSSDNFIFCEPNSIFFTV